jgi:hypothetical protein
VYVAIRVVGVVVVVAAEHQEGEDEGEDFHDHHCLLLHAEVHLCLLQVQAQKFSFPLLLALGDLWVRHSEVASSSVEFV